MITKAQEDNIKQLIKDHRKSGITGDAAMIALNLIVNGSEPLTEKDKEWVKRLSVGLAKKEN